MKTRNTRGMIDRTTYQLAQKVIKSDDNCLTIFDDIDNVPNDYGADNTFNDAVALGLFSNCFIKSDGSSVKLIGVLDNDLLNHFVQYRDEFYPCRFSLAIVTNSDSYDSRPKSVNLDINLMKDIKSITQYLQMDSRLHSLDGLPMIFDRKGITSAIVLGSVMNLFMNRFGHRPIVHDEPLNVRSRGVFYCIEAVSDTLVKVLGWDWYIGANNIFVICSYPRDFQVTRNEIFDIIVNDVERREDRYLDYDREYDDSPQV